MSTEWYSRKPLLYADVVSYIEKGGSQWRFHEDISHRRVNMRAIQVKHEVTGDIAVLMEMSADYAKVARCPDHDPFEGEIEITRYGGNKIGPLLVELANKFDTEWTDYCGLSLADHVDP